MGQELYDRAIGQAGEEFEDYSMSGEDGSIREIGSLQLLLEPAYHGMYPIRDACAKLIGGTGIRRFR
jgi:hypothetical protein